MKWPGCDNLRLVRERLGKSQAELAALLGISVRAVQSYEQGWRGLPVAVGKLASLLCHLAWRKDQGPLTPCWEAQACGTERRDQCVVYQLRAGDMCWLFDGRDCSGKRHGAPAAEPKDCAHCPVTRSWMPVAE